MTYGDGFAAIVGKTIKSKEYKIGGSTKTIAGSAVMLILSFIIALGAFTYCNTQFLWIKAIGIALVATILEAISGKGTDNLTVPIATSLMTYFLI